MISARKDDLISKWLGTRKNDLQRSGLDDGAAAMEGPAPEVAGRRQQGRGGKMTEVLDFVGEES